MPTYEYICTECGEGLEVVQSFKDDALTECPACTGRLRKVYGNVGVAFKGSGFYKTDSRSGASTKGATTGSEPSAAKPDGKSDAKTDSKPAESPSQSPAPSQKPADSATKAS